jgi:hypothetical protein
LSALACSTRDGPTLLRRVGAAAVGGMVLVLGTVAPVGCNNEQSAFDPDARAAVKIVKRALDFDSEFEGRRICRRVFTQSFMEDVSAIENESAVIVCRLTRLSRTRQGRVAAATRKGNRVHVTIELGKTKGTAWVISTPDGWRIYAARGGALPALIGVKEYADPL